MRPSTARELQSYNSLDSDAFFHFDVDPNLSFLFCFQDGEAYAYLLNALAPEHSSHVALETKDPTERAKRVLEQAEKLDCKRYLSPKDIVDGSANLNLAFVAQIFQHRLVANLTGCLKKCDIASFQWGLNH